MNDLLLFALNGGGWALKPILEKYQLIKLVTIIFPFLDILSVESLQYPFLSNITILMDFQKSTKIIANYL